jgi:hypothetical protein
MQFTAENSFLLQPLCNFLLLITTMLFVVRDRMGGVRWRCRRLRYGVFTARNSLGADSPTVTPNTAAERRPPLV